MGWKMRVAVGDLPITAPSRGAALKVLQMGRAL